MTNRYQQDCKAAIERIIAAIPKQKEAEALKAFASELFHTLSLGDLEEMPPALAAEIAELVYGDFKQVAHMDAPNITIHTPAFLKEHFGRNRVAITIINRDMPFLVDSVTIALKNMGFTLYRTVHPQLTVKRDASGKLLPANAPTTAYEESCIYAELSPMPDDVDAVKLVEQLQITLKFVYKAVADWRVMVAKAREVSTHIVMSSKVLDDKDIEEATDFFDWLLKNNFIFLGFVEYDFYNSEGEECFAPVEGSQLGVFRIEEYDLLHRGLSSLPPEVRHFALQSDPLEITKSNRRSMVHRDVLMDYIGVKRYDASGKVIGESRFLGLFTSPVYYQETQKIPYIRRKVQAIIDVAGFDKSGHSGKALKAALEFFPRDELFQISTDDLLEITLGIISLEERPDIRVFFRRDKFERFVSCFVYMPRDKFNTFVRSEIAKVLEKHLQGSVTAFYSQLTDSPLARVNYIIKTNPGHIPDVNVQTINKELRFIINYWVDSLREALQDAFGEQMGEHYFREFGDAFPRNYVNTTQIDAALDDINHLRQVIERNTPRFNLFISEATKTWHLKMYGYLENIALTDILPMIENLGFKVRDVMPYRLKVNLGKEEPAKMLIRDFSLIAAENHAHSFHAIKPLVEELLHAVWAGDSENDALNGLATLAGLNQRQITLLRAYVRYARQTGISYSEAYMMQALCKHAGIAALLVTQFEQRFDPSMKRGKEQKEAYTAVIDALTNVDNLAEDKILRFFAETIQATLRTNYYQQKIYLSFKLDSAAVPDLPLPRPFREIFVYSMTTEGIHLRGGMVARGGLRWSDRHEDFRTEVLGLMKAQLVKNTVIVPTGSKGGFVVKAAFDPQDRDARMEAGIASYKQFLSGLLDITDNRVDDSIVPPAKVVRYDEDDPYLVVAADKGTATFSDIANGVARDYGFWLDDAFASGGSAGYDHKKMGITARGGWVSVQRHFLEMGKDIQKQDFTVVGIGDMSGDVFGNGMLLSEHIRLLGAFNHLHIFIDPNPDAKRSFAERRRLFDIGRGSWDAYDPNLISKGGGVFLRSAKTITLTPEMKTLLHTKANTATPNEVIRLLLKADVDLLWNGGIGTYVKSRSESHESVGDPGNNGLRVNGEELRCKVVGEGGNLGFTQLGRIEYARNGGRINTDAIDNSAGVDCSDHEVNIKIALTSITKQTHMTLEARNQLLADMTENVAELVLDDNRQQNQALSIAERRAREMLEIHGRFMQSLENTGLLDRTVEHLPSKKELDNLKADGLGLTRPELAILLAYSKIALYGVLSDSKLVDSPVFDKRLLQYFPQQLQTAYAPALLEHPLKREIIATSLTNEIINRAGITYIYTIFNDSGHEVCNIVRAYVVVREMFRLGSLWEDIEALQGTLEADTQLALFAEVTRFLERMSIWFLTNTPQPLEMETVLQEYQPRMDAFQHSYERFVSKGILQGKQEKIDALLHANVPAAIAERIAMLELLISAADVAYIDQQSPLDLAEVGEVYYTLGTKLELGWLHDYLAGFPTEHHWDRLAVRNAVNELYEEQRRLTLSVVQQLCKQEGCKTALEQWLEAHQGEIERYQRVIHDIKSTERHDMSMLVVLLRKLSTIRVV